MYEVDLLTIDFYMIITYRNLDYNYRFLTLIGYLLIFIFGLLIEITRFQVRFQPA